MLQRFLAIPLLVLVGAPLAAQRYRTNPFPPRIPGRILVSGFNSDALHSYRAWDGAPRLQASAPGAQSTVLGSDGLLYVCAEKVDEVVRIDPDTFEVVDAFVRDDPQTPEDENGPLDGPTSATFGPGGDLYVASFNTDRVLRYDGATGAYEGTFVSVNSGGLNGPDAGTKFGPDGYFYVPSFFNDRILRYDPTGAFVDEFVPFRVGSLRQPRDLTFRAGHWYVASSGNNRILRYDASGNFVDVFASVGRPYSLAFHPNDHNLYVVNLLANTVVELDGDSGVFLRTAVASGAGGIDGAVFVSFLP